VTATIRCRLPGSHHLLTLVPVAAISVASIRLHCADVVLDLKYHGPNPIPCYARLRKGDG
jgi:phosphatidylserine decarboxylase